MLTLFLTLVTFIYRYIDAADNSHLIKDKAYNRIKKNLDGFMDRLLSSKGEELLFEMVSNVYYKQRKAIQTKSESDIELLLSTLMATLIEQNLEIKRLILIIIYETNILSG